MLLSEFDPCRDAVINPEMCIKETIDCFLLFPSPV